MQAGLNIAVKRHFFSDPVEGERCYSDNAWGYWKSGDCIAVRIYCIMWDLADGSRMRMSPWT